MRADDRWNRAMERALELAGRSPLPDPNPRVGCVLVDDSGRVVGRGWHHGAGTPHAEIEALRSVGGPLPKGVTAVVTLEPCNHTGRTGPCSQALIAAGVSRVVIGLADPNPLAAGGAQTLRRAGAEVIEGVLADRSAALNEDWLFAVRHGRPKVVWKYAATLDGRSAAADGTSRWITSEAARRQVHRERARCAAVMVGTGTVLADDPNLTVRGVEVAQQPLRVVVGRSEIPAGRHVLDDRAPTLLIREHHPAAVLSALDERGIHRVWLEGGPHLAGAFWAAGLVDEVVAHLAPALLGAGPAALQDAGVGTIAGAHRLVIDEVSMLGPDIQVRAHPDRSPAPPGTQCGAQRRTGDESALAPGQRHIAYREGGARAAPRPEPSTGAGAPGRQQTSHTTGRGNNVHRNS